MLYGKVIDNTERTSLYLCEHDIEVLNKLVRIEYIKIKDKDNIARQYLYTLLLKLDHANRKLLDEKGKVR